MIHVGIEILLEPLNILNECQFVRREVFLKVQHTVLNEYCPALLCSEYFTSKLYPVGNL